VDFAKKENQLTSSVRLYRRISKNSPAVLGRIWTTLSCRMMRISSAFMPWPSLLHQSRLVKIMHEFGQTPLNTSRAGPCRGSNRPTRLNAQVLPLRPDGQEHFQLYPQPRRPTLRLTLAFLPSFLEASRVLLRVRFPNSDVTALWHAPRI
jgi:hypothetical protein